MNNKPSRLIIFTGVLVLALASVAGSSFAFYLQKDRISSNTNKTVETTKTTQSNNNPTPTSTITPTEANQQKNASTQTVIPKKELSSDTLKNISYPITENNKDVKLVNGKGEFTLITNDGKGTAAFEDQALAFGDLNNDGQNDAIVSIRTNYGGTGYFSNVFVVINANGVPKLTKVDASLQDRDVINSITINSGIVTMNLTVHGQNDSASTPTQKTTVKYKFENGKFVKL